MSNVVSWIPKQNNRIVMYEVVGEGDKSEFGSENMLEALNWFTRNPINKRMVVTNWFADEEDASPIGEPIDITSILLSAIGYGRGRSE